MTHWLSHWVSCGQTRPQIEGNRLEFVDDAEGAIQVPHDQVTNETWNVDRHRAAGNTGGLPALDAALRFLQGILEAKAEVDLLEIGGALDRVALGHGDLRRSQLRQLLVAALFFLEQGLLEIADVRVIRIGLGLLALEPLLAGDQLLEVDLMAVEIGSLHASETHLPVDGNAAGAAHAGAVDHDRVEGHHGLDAERARGLDAGVHHRQRSDGHHQVRRVGLEDALQRLCHKAGSAIAAVVGADDQIVAVSLKTIFPENQVFVAETDDAGGPVSRFVKGTKLRKDRRHAEATTDQHHVSNTLDVLR